jgi:hypothetical protein
MNHPNGVLYEQSSIAMAIKHLLVYKTFVTANTSDTWLVVQKVIE